MKAAPRLPEWARSASLVELPMDVAGELAGDPRNRLDLLGRRVQEPLGRAEVAEQRPLPDRADAAEPVQDRAGHRLAAAPAVQVEGEAVGLVADALEQSRRVRFGADRQRLRASRHIDLLEALGER